MMRIPEMSIQECDFKLWYFIIVISSLPRLRISCYSYRTYSYSKYFSQQMHLIKHILWQISNSYPSVPKHVEVLYLSWIVFYSVHLLVNSKSLVQLTSQEYWNFIWLLCI